MTHAYIAVVYDGWSQNPFVIGVSLSLEAIKRRVVEDYPDAVPYGDDYSYFSGTQTRINIEPWELID